MGGGIALQSAGADPRIEAVVAEASFANLQEAAYDYAGLRSIPGSAKRFLLQAPGSWSIAAKSWLASPPPRFHPSKPLPPPLPVLIICDEEDHALPCRHSEMIFRAARGPKEFWRVARAWHTVLSATNQPNFESAF